MCSSDLIGAKAQLVVEIVDAAQFTVAFSPRPGVSVGDPVFASDIDAGQTPRLRYYIKTQDSNAGPNGFRIDPETAQLTVDEAYLNYEDRTTYTIVVGTVDVVFVLMAQHHHLVTLITKVFLKPMADAV